MRGRRANQTDEEVQTEGDAGEAIDISAHEPRRIPSKKWRELIKSVWEADPLRCAKCSWEMRIVSLIDEEDVIERILRHLGLWQEGVRVHSGTDPPGETTLDPWLDDPFPDYDTEPVWRSPPPETSGSARVRLSHPLFSGPSPPAAKKPVFDFRAHFCHSAPMETHAFGFRLRANAPEGQKRFPISSVTAFIGHGSY